MTCIYLLSPLLSISYIYIQIYRRIALWSAGLSIFPILASFRKLVASQNPNITGDWVSWHSQGVYRKKKAPQHIPRYTLRYIGICGRSGGRRYPYVLKDPKRKTSNSDKYGDRRARLLPVPWRCRECVCTQTLDELGPEPALSLLFAPNSIILAALPDLE